MKRVGLRNTDKSVENCEPLVDRGMETSHDAAVSEQDDGRLVVDALSRVPLRATQ
jgi:hypothetical protein